MNWYTSIHAQFPCTNLDYPVWSIVKDIMHVGTVVSSGTKSSDVELAQLLLLGQLNVMAEVAVVTLIWLKP